MFHIPRFRAKHPRLWTRIWEFHDDHPLPDRLNRIARALLNLTKRALMPLSRQYSKGVGGEKLGVHPVPSEHFLPTQSFQAIPYSDVCDWFRRIHEANEALLQKDGSWLPHPYSYYAGHGVSIEEVALRIPGYINAHEATRTEEYLNRAKSAGAYLLEKRLFADGNVLLQGHQSIDFCYTLAGIALLHLWRLDTSENRYFEAARRIGDQLVACHISGSPNHAIIPAQLLGPLYRLTGDRRYLDTAHRRVFSYTLPFQLRSGDWSGYQGYAWYQAILLRSMIAAYVATPFSLEFSHKKDKLARAITAAANWFVSVQQPDGSLPITRAGGYSYPAGERDVVSFDGTTFARSKISGGYRGHGAYEIDALVSLNLELSLDEFIPVLHGYSRSILETSRFWRLEFNTLGAGTYLGFLNNIRERPAASLLKAPPDNRFYHIRPVATEQAISNSL